ncbi:MAG: hypothetical protein WC700_19500 [Gemmatimonadaceae bacterium]|jgi:hypothetical protein
MPGFGTGAWGTSPWGLGAPPAAFALNFVRVIDANTVRATFTDVPQTLHDRITADALNPANYTISIVTGPFGAWAPVVAKVYQVDGDTLSVDLRLDRTLPGTMRGQQTNLRVTVANVISAAGVPMIGATYQNFYGLNRVVNETTRRLERSVGRDLSNPFTPNSPAGGTFRIGTSGDYKFATGMELVKKMVYRRLLTPKGAFFHLPDYGMGLKPKSVAYPYMLTSARAEMKRQILQEPEVQDCSVKVTQNASQIVVFFVHVRTKQGVEGDLRLTVQPGGSVVPG